MPPKRSPSKPLEQNGSNQSQKVSGNNTNTKSAPPSGKKEISEAEIKKTSSMSAQLALEAAKKAYELRQAAYGAGDPDAREQILAKAINKEIEAESFGKAAKYTRSGAFQGLAAGAGLGVQPGVVLGQLTGALVGGLLASVGGLVGGGVGSVYGAIKGPFWDLGEMASHGVRSIVGDFPNWKATPSQKQALEKMVLGAQQTKPPSQEELEQMRDDDGGFSEQEYQQSLDSLKSWIPGMPSMPSWSSLSASLSGSGAQPRQSTTAQNGDKASSGAKLTPRQQSKASTDANPSSKPQSNSSQSSTKTGTSQQPQTPNENTVKRKPKKLEIRSANKTSQSQSGQSAQTEIRKSPPKLGPRKTPANTAAKTS